MNKEKEALLKAIQAEPDVPKKVATKNLLRFIERMQPETLEMRNFLIAKFSAETRAESRSISEAWYAKMTPLQQQAFSEAYHRCCMNELENSKKIRAKPFVGELAPSV
jgi:Flp pilus assembly CpaE family ATPase